MTSAVLGTLAVHNASKDRKDGSVERPRVTALQLHGCAVYAVQSEAEGAQSETDGSRQQLVSFVASWDTSNAESSSHATNGGCAAGAARERFSVWLEDAPNVAGGIEQDDQHDPRGEDRKLYEQATAIFLGVTNRRSYHGARVSVPAAWPALQLRVVMQGWDGLWDRNAGSTCPLST